MAAPPPPTTRTITTTITTNRTSIVGSFLSAKLFTLFLIFLHLGCFVFSTNHNHDQDPYTPARTNNKKKRKPLSSSWSYLRRIFSSAKTFKNGNSKQTHPSTPTLTSARSSHHSLVSLADVPPRVKHPKPCPPESDISADNSLFFPLRNDIFPCTVCGEIFQKQNLLEQHQAIKHAVTELFDGDSSKNIVDIIFKTGWSAKEKSPAINRILKIHSSPKILSRFEEYREFVKAKAARSNGGVKKRDERCIADGNELLRFYCSTFLCDLGANGNSSICNQQYCSVCGIIKSGFSPKLDGISTLSTSWRAHVSIPEEIEGEFRFMNVKRAMLVCRVVAGRVGCDGDDEVDKEDGGFDSVVGRRGSGAQTRLDEEELLVFNPRAVLPCFVIVYTV